MDTSDRGNQPFTITTDTKIITWMCNGEIYNHLALESEYDISHLLESTSDCECIGYLYQKLWFEQMLAMLDGEFVIALIVNDVTTDAQELYLWRDFYGVRPLFVWYHEDTIVWRASEAKALVDDCDYVRPLPAWSFYDSVNGMTQSYIPRHYSISQAVMYDEDQATKLIRESLYQAVAKRLVADRPVWCLLSGWLDSSLVCGIAAELTKWPIHTYTIWLEWGTDIMYAEMVAQYIGSIHKTYIITIQEALDAIKHVIYVTETRDTTTIRASVWQYLLGKKNQSD